MNTLRNWTYQEVTKFLTKNGFIHRGTKGSHSQYTKQAESKKYTVTVPKHGSKAIHTKTMTSIARQSGIPKERWTR